MRTLEIIMKLKAVGLYPSQYDEGYAITVNGEYPKRWVDHLDLCKIYGDLIIVNGMYSVYNDKVYGFNWSSMSSPVNSIDSLRLATTRLA